MQTRLQSLIEVAASTFIAFWLSVLVGYFTYPIFGHKFSVLDNIALTSIFTVWSMIRSYWLRRFFNWYFTGRKACKKLEK